MKSRKSFYRALKKIAHLFKWENTGGDIRAIYNGHTFCPITALYYARKGEWRPSYQYDKVAATLGLPLQEAHIIVNAADNAFEKKKNTPAGRARKALLRAISPK